MHHQLCQMWENTNAGERLANINTKNNKTVIAANFCRI